MTGPAGREANEETQETLALLKILELGEREAQQGLTKPALDVIAVLIAKTPDAGGV